MRCGKPRDGRPAGTVRDSRRGLVSPLGTRRSSPLCGPRACIRIGRAHVNSAGRDWYLRGFARTLYKLMFAMSAPATPRLLRRLNAERALDALRESGPLRVTELMA